MGNKIIFRGVAYVPPEYEWDDSVLPWVYGDIVTNGTTAVIKVSGAVYVPVYPETVGQYLGVKDNSGKHVFDGDILRDDSGHFWIAHMSRIPFIKSAKGTVSVLYNTNLLTLFTVTDTVCNWRIRRACKTWEC